ncbi:MAG: hypothetical protein RL007_2812 [Bacteroidota bacterium]|jgi:hypothetical protein
MENKYAEGSFVYAKADPATKLKIRRYVDRVYYCRIEGDADEKELVYFEREIMPEDEGALMI